MYKDKTLRRLAKGFKALVKASLEVQNTDMVKNDLRRSCPKCNGTGQYTPDFAEGQPNPNICICNECSGSGKKPYMLEHLDSWCTVWFRGPRRCGHTTMMFKVAHELFENPAFVFMNEKMISLFKEDMTKGKAYSQGTLYKMRGTQHDAVFVDCAFWFEEKHMDEIRNYAAAMLGSKGKIVLAYLE